MTSSDDLRALDPPTLPLDEVSRAAASALGLDYRLLDTSDQAAYDDFLSAIRRGFLDAEASPEFREGSRDTIRYRRFTGVHDPHSPAPRVPVATIDSWMTELSLPGDVTIPMWAISGVTVSPTHRRRGLARLMVEGELRTAAAAGLAIAGLTVSEATIYGRFGFGPAVFSTDWTIRTQRAVWTGPRPDGRLDYLDREAVVDELSALHDRVRSRQPGETRAWRGLWQRKAGTVPGQEEVRGIRAVRYTDADGQTRGILLHRIAEENDADAVLTIDHLLADGDDAYAALWRFALEHDLVTSVVAHKRSVDEPVRWMIADQRAATEIRGDHEWLRVLDVPAVLSARRYGAAGSWSIRVHDPLGFADGTWMLAVAPDGTGAVTATDTAPDIELGVDALASILLGGVRPSTLRAAGRLRAGAEKTHSLDRALASTETPFLSFWY